MHDQDDRYHFESEVDGQQSESVLVCGYQQEQHSHTGADERPGNPLHAHECGLCQAGLQRDDGRDR